MRFLVVAAEVRDGAGQDVAPGALFLRHVRQGVRRGRLPREGGARLLPRRLLRRLRAQVPRLQARHPEQLRHGARQPLAPRVLRVPGDWALL